MNDRRDELIAAARAVIAERGFEGLRTRDVAERVGLNHATLHHYFSTKEELIGAVIRGLVESLASRRAAFASADVSALDALHAYFSAVRAQLHDTPDSLVVLQEFFMRAGRNDALADIVSDLEAGWGGFLTSLLRRGIAEGSFRDSLDVDATAQLIMGVFKSLGTPPRDPMAIGRLFAQLEAWILVDDGIAKKQPRRRAKRRSR